MRAAGEGEAWTSSAPWVLEALAIDAAREASLEHGDRVADEWHRGKFFTPTDAVLRDVARERGDRS